MATAAENWFVLLPDGRTIRARNADVVRNQVRAGRIPPGSQVRRSSEHAWQPIDHVADFVDAAATVAPEGGLTQRPRSPGEGKTVGARGLVEELLNAFDNSLSRVKLTVAALTGLLLAIGLIAVDLIWAYPVGTWTAAGYLAIALYLLSALALGTVLLTQMTFIELDRHRPANASEVRAGLLGQTLRVVIAQGGVIGTLVGFMLLVRSASPWLAAHDLGDLNALRDVLIVGLSVVRPILEVLCWPLVGLAVLQLGPLLVIEDYSIARSLLEWLAMVRRHLGRIYLYEALAITLAVVLALPMLLLVGLAILSGTETNGLPERITLSVLGGVALAPMIAYLIVANVFIYLNLRYEYFYTPHD